MTNSEMETTNLQHIKNQVVAGILWKGGYLALHQIVSFVVKIVLVRLLLPADFGLIAMAMIVFSSLDVLNRLVGFDPYVVDNDSDMFKAKNTLFFMNIVFYGITAFFAFISAPYVTQFFSETLSDSHSSETLVAIIKVLALRHVIGSLSLVSVAELTKQLKFRKLYTGNMLGTCVYFFSAPVLAYFGFGVWAIILAHLFEQIVIVIFFLIVQPFFPRLVFDRKIFKRYVLFNAHLFLSSLCVIVVTQGDNAVIGRLLGPAILGFYSIGKQFSMLPVLIVSRNVSEIMFPVFSQLRGDTEKFERAFLRAFRLINVCAFPLIGGTVVLAKEIVVYFFGERWLPIVPIYYVLSLSSLFAVISNIAGPVLKSLNKPDTLRNSELIKLPLFVAMVYPFASLWGHLGVCWLMVILSTASFIYLTAKLAKEINDFNKSLGKMVFRISFATLLMMATVYVFKQMFSMTPVTFLLAVLLGVGVYVCVMLIYDRQFPRDIREFILLIKKKTLFTPG